MIEQGLVPILVADDHPLVRAGIVATLKRDGRFQVVAEAGDGDEVLELLKQHHPQLLLLDLKMRTTDPASLILECRRIRPELKVLVFSAYSGFSYLVPLREAGVQGFVLKEEGPASLLQAIRVVLSGTTWYSQGVREKMTKIIREKPVHLTPREREVLVALSQGKDNQTVAELLNISKETVRRNLTSIYSKLGVKNRVEAMLWLSEK